ncbi:MAG: hypothetical protein ABI881_08745 [Betaproteobacteria bacterium]
MGLLLLAAGINTLVDPYGFYRLVYAHGFNAIKPRAEQQVSRDKAYGIVFSKPHAVILGNSRAEIGIDPSSPVWGSAQVVYNAAIPGSGVPTIVEYLEHAIAQGHVTRAVVGLEFLDFLADPPSTAAPSVDTGRSTSMDWKSKGNDAIAAIFSLDALSDSLVTVFQQRNPYAPDITANGFNPMRDYEGIAAAEGYGTLFLQKNRENAKNYLRAQKRLEAHGRSLGPSWRALERLRAICSTGSVQCYFLIYPYHADTLELFDAAGLWPLFEDWKRQLVLRLGPQEETKNAAGDLWDFSGYSRFTTEPVPARSDRKTPMRWYWEAGHFKAALGEEMLHQMFDSGYDSFGERLSAANIDQHLMTLRDQRNRYREEYPEKSGEIRRLVSSLDPK